MKTRMSTIAGVVILVKLGWRFLSIHRILAFVTVVIGLVGWQPDFVLF